MKRLITLMMVMVVMVVSVGTVEARHPWDSQPYYGSRSDYGYGGGYYGGGYYGGGCYGNDTAQIIDSSGRAIIGVLGVIGVNERSEEIIRQQVYAQNRPVVRNQTVYGRARQQICTQNRPVIKKEVYIIQQAPQDQNLNLERGVEQLHEVVQELDQAILEQGQIIAEQNKKMLELQKTLDDLEKEIKRLESPADPNPAKSKAAQSGT